MLLCDCFPSEHPRMTVGPSVLACGQVNKKGIRNVPYKDRSLICVLHTSSEVVGLFYLLGSCQEVDRKCTSLHLEICLKMLHHQLWHFFGAYLRYGNSQAVLGDEPCAITPLKIQVD